MIDELNKGQIERFKEKQILKNYPKLTADSLQAVFAFAAECMREEALFAISKR